MPLRSPSALEAAAQLVERDRVGLVALEPERLLEVRDQCVAEREVGLRPGDDFVEPAARERELLGSLHPGLRRGRQGLLAEIAQEYQVLLDHKLNRVHAGITLANEADARTQKQVVERLTKSLEREIRAYFRSDPRILGGVVVRIGDRIYDGSVRRRLTAIQRRMLTGE